LVLVAAVTALLVASSQSGPSLLDQLRALRNDRPAAVRLVRARQADTRALLDELRDSFDASIHSARTRPEQRKVEYDGVALDLGITISRLYADVTEDTHPWRRFTARKARIEGTEYLNARDYRPALARLDAALRDAEALDDVWLMVITRLNIAYARIELGEARLARDLCVRAARDAERLGPRAKGLAAFDLAAAYVHLEEYTAAIPYAEAAARYSREAGIKLWEGNALLNLGVAYRQIGEGARARASLEQALAVITQTADQLGTGRTLYNLALVSTDERDSAKAAAYLERALPIIERVDVRHSHEIELDPKQYYNSVQESALRLIVRTYTTLHEPAKAARHQAALDALLRTKPHAAEPPHAHGGEPH
jgi:tetratricopeptide (TPR) repeat protein